MEKSILVTGASGLLGKALVRMLVEKNFFVFAQYHSELPEPIDNCEWLQADFSTLNEIRDFLIINSLKFKRCQYLINNYGPIVHKSISDLNAEDFILDFHHNVITAFEIMDFFLKYTQVRGIVNVGFEDVGKLRPYKKILTYAAAKNSLQLITESFKAHYKQVDFFMSAPTTLEGAEVIKSRKEKPSDPLKVAEEIVSLLP
ncbi:MAG: SDR family oxidoreductase [bacterium]|nr:SDR family oxidoreductase [bacterium]